MSEDGRVILREPPHVSVSDDEMRRFGLMDGDLLVTRTGSIGRCAVYSGDLGPALPSAYLIRFRLKREVCGPEFLVRYLLAPFGQATLGASSTAVTQPNVNAQAIGAVPLALPPLGEQRRIVAKLEALQARSRRARAALDTVPPLLEKLRQSILAAAFRGDLTKDWRAKNKNVEPAEKLLARIRVERRKKWEEAELAKMTAKGKVPKDDGWKAKYKEPEPVDTAGLPELPEGWCWASLEELALIESGQTTDGLADHPSSEDRHVPWFRISDMNHEDNAVTMRVSEVWLSESDVRRFGLHVRPAGTIVFPKRGGAIATNKKRRLGQASAYDLNTMGIIPIDSLAEYVWTWFQLVDLGRLNTGTAVPQINHGDIAPLHVPVPPYEEAKQIASVVSRQLTRLQECGAGLRETSGRVETLDRALLAKAFRGELVPQDPNDEPAEATLARLGAPKDDAGAPAAGAKTTAKKRAVRA